MQFEVKPFGKKYRFDQESNITDVVYTISGLRITVIAATSMFTDIYIDIHFSSVSGFRLLDEGNLTAYWESEAFNSNHHIYEVLSGGWSNGEALPDGILSSREFIGFREWFIATTNECITVLSGEEPQIREITNPSISS
ncbi:MAG TPA: hypothetical protein VNI84_15370 [Pyrinomonadaceae bacterium]|nr:hypothetical protein [Pyrinomonadaceae bacterium]